MTQSTFETLRPLLNSTAAKELDAINDVQSRFPGKSWKEIAREIDNLIDKASGDLSTIIQRLSTRVAGSSTESIDALVKSLKKLSKDDLTSVGKELGLECSGTKTRVVNDLKQWLQSGGSYRPKTAAEAAAEKIGSFTAKWKQLTATPGEQSTTELLNLIDAVAKLTKPELEAFCQSVNLSFTGSKAKIKNSTPELRSATRCLPCSNDNALTVLDRSCCPHKNPRSRLADDANGF